MSLFTSLLIKTDRIAPKAIHFDRPNGPIDFEMNHHLLTFFYLIDTMEIVVSFGVLILQLNFYIFIGNISKMRYLFNRNEFVHSHQLKSWFKLSAPCRMGKFCGCVLY